MLGAFVTFEVYRTLREQTHVLLHDLSMMTGSDVPEDVQMFCKKKENMKGRESMTGCEERRDDDVFETRYNVSLFHPSVKNM